MSSSWALLAALLGLAPAAAADLPLAPERALVLRHCVACHSIDRVQHSGGSKAGWEDRINRMVRWGARISPEEIEPVATYLARSLPVRPAPPPLQAFFTNTAVSTVGSQSVHATLRVATEFDAVTKVLLLWLTTEEAQKIRIGQHLRALSPYTRAEMLTANVIQIRKQGNRYRVTAAVSTAVHAPVARYVAEIGIDLGVFLAVPNEAIIDDGDQQFVYVLNSRAGYERRLVSVGVQGERLTQVVSGLSIGEQVVTVGGFFIDAAYKLAAAS